MLINRFFAEMNCLTKILKRQISQQEFSKLMLH